MAICERTVSVHGHAVTCREVAGPRHAPDDVVILLHGLAGSMGCWTPVLREFAARDGRTQVIAVDLLGHGRSTDPRGDHSMGGYATAVRDLLAALDIRHATVAGHSLGGGVAMQFAHQFPDWCDRLVLVSSGGLGRSVHPLLRAATLPGAELLLPFVANRALVAAGDGLLRLAAGLGLGPPADAREYLRNFATLCGPRGRAVFTRTVRSALDLGGQRLSGRDRLYLMSDLPVLLMWGAEDPVVPVEHAMRAWRELPSAEIELFDGVGHFPHRAEPERFVDVLTDFLRRRPPAEVAAEQVCQLIRQAG